MNNHWLSSETLDEKTILKIIEWAHRKEKLVENLTRLDIEEAIKSHMREASHS
jgi:hypothetical protein